MSSVPFDDTDPAGESPEDRVNALRGYKATIKNPRVSDEAKKHAQDVLDNVLGGDRPREELQAMNNTTKDPVRVQAGLKAATKNYRVSDEAKESAQERVAQLSNYIAEQPEE